LDFGHKDESLQRRGKHKIGKGDRGQKNKSQESGGEKKVQIDWQFLLPPLGQCLGPMGTQLGTQALQ
jgi:hypothetical protein